MNRAVFIGLLAAMGWQCSPVSTCSTSNCPGCCDAQGMCQPGTASTACGERGATCQACGLSMCSAGRCAAGGGIVASGGGTTQTAGGSAGGTIGGGIAMGGGQPGSACDRAASLVQSKCGAAAGTVMTQCQTLSGSSCSAQAGAWFDCLVMNPQAVTCPGGNFGSQTACLTQYSAMRTCLQPTGGGQTGGGGGSAGGMATGQPCQNTSPTCPGTNLYCALRVTPDGTSDGEFASTGACRKSCQDAFDCGAGTTCCPLRNASSKVCLPGIATCDPVSVCKANGQSCVNDTNCCSRKCSALFYQCETP